MVPVRCWPEEPCRSKSVEFAIDNCSATSVGVRRLLVAQGSQTHMTEFDPPLVVGAGDRHVFTYPPEGHKLLLERGRHLLVAALDHSSIEERTFTIVDPGLEEARVECLARGDDWGHHGGMFSVLGCEAVMPDESRACGDARDCKGVCIQRGAVGVPRDMKRVFGVCSRFKVQFGCFTAIGHTAQGLMPANRSFGFRCVD